MRRSNLHLQIIQKVSFIWYFNIETYMEANDSFVIGSTFFLAFLRCLSLFQNLRMAFVDLRSTFFNDKLFWSTRFTHSACLSLHFDSISRVCDTSEVEWLDRRRKCDWNRKCVFLRFASILDGWVHIFRIYVEVWWIFFCYVVWRLWLNKRVLHNISMLTRWSLRYMIKFRNKVNFKSTLNTSFSFISNCYENYIK